MGAWEELRELSESMVRGGKQKTVKESLENLVEGAPLTRALLGRSGVSFSLSCMFSCMTLHECLGGNGAFMASFLGLRHKLFLAILNKTLLLEEFTRVILSQMDFFHICFLFLCHFPLTTEGETVQCLDWLWHGPQYQCEIAQFYPRFSMHDFSNIQ